MCTPGRSTAPRETVELQAWQTKTVSAARIRRHPVPLICPKYSFSGKDWWSGFGSPDTQADPGGTVQRYGLPDTHSQQRLQWCHLPPQHSGPRSEMAERSTLPTRRHRELIDPLTWHSFRVFIPDCAFQLGVPRTQRQYLGNWLTESTADVYTREKRNVVVSIWQRVASKVDTLNMKPGRERREDLNHPDWDEPILDLEEEPQEGRVPVDTPSNGHRAVAAGVQSPMTGIPRPRRSYSRNLHQDH